MTDDDIAAIRARIHEAWDEPGGFDVLYGTSETVVRDDLHNLLAEVERLRTFVHEVAGDHQHEWDAVDPQEVWACAICHEVSHDYAEVIQQDARELLGTDLDKEE